MRIINAVSDVVTGIIFALVCVGCNNPGEWDVDRIFADFIGERPGASVLVVKEGKFVFRKGYGLADPDRGAIVTPLTNFRLASVTKQFTAMAVLILIDRGMLSLDTALTDIFSGFPAYGGNVTVRHLLTHTSGLIAYESLMNDDYPGQVHDQDVFGMMAACDSTYFEPGTAYRYSNSGYAVLAMIVEAVSGVAFDVFLTDNIFMPIGMNGTVAYRDGVNDVNNRAFGYAWEGDEFVLSDQSPTSAVLGDGGVYSSVIDLARWDRALYTDQLVPRSLMEQAFTQNMLPDGTQTDYGFGWNLDDYRGLRRIGHTGSTCGFRTVIHRFPDTESCVIILTNRRTAPVDSLAEQVADVLLFQLAPKQ